MRQTRSATILLTALAAVSLTACGDVTLPDRSDLESAASSLASQASSAISSATDRPPGTPTTEPTSADPTSAEPTTTASPTTTVTPTTSAPSVTSTAPTSTAPVASPTTSPETAPASSSSATWWWVLLAVLAVAAGVGFWLISRKRRAANQWQSQYDAAVQQAVWVAEAPVTNVVEAPSPEAMDNAWRQTYTELNGVDQALFALRDTAPDATRAQRLDTARAAVAGLQTALLDVVERARENAPADLQRRAAVVAEQARAALRSALTPPPSG